ncbi:MAG: 2-amino-4-hydroxy-6-hydroxymethyldihydropteridine diphosphokinase [Bryobacteraceae bacterium]
MKIAYLSLGSNLGERERALREAIARLEAPSLKVLRVSSFYETAPQDFRDQPWFLNAVVEVETGLFPKQLLARIARIELAMGRKRLQPKGPRIIDIDILLYGSSIVAAPELTIPHPGLAARRFVLEPLAELAPELRHPVTKRTVREMLAGVGDQAVRRLP